MRAITERAPAALLAVRPVDWTSDDLPDPAEPDEIDRRNLEPVLRAFLVR